jgi:uncharacterized protein (UPF0548 family)
MRTAPCWRPAAHQGIRVRRTPKSWRAHSAAVVIGVAIQRTTKRLPAGASEQRFRNSQGAVTAWPPFQH